MLRLSIRFKKVQAEGEIAHIIWFNACVTFSVLGVLCVAIATQRARFERPGAIQLFWLGLLLVVVPATLRLLSKVPRRNERIALVLMLGLALYGVKILRSPLYFTFYDEFIHLRTINDVLQSRQLFTINPLLEVSALYPGLEILTDGFVSLTHSSVFLGGIVVIGVARVVLVLALFLVGEQVTGSSETAGVATLLYTLNPNFLYLDAQFAYESLALPLLVMVLFVIAWWENQKRSNRLSALCLVLLLSLAITITHHITSFILIAFLLIWNFGFIFRKTLSRSSAMLLKKRQRRSSSAQRPQDRGRFLFPFFILVIVTVMVFVWIFTVATLTLNYLGPTTIGAVREILLLISGEAKTRSLFVSNTGYSAPPEERLIGLLATALVVLAIPVGLIGTIKLRRYSALLFTLAIVAISYPASFIFRFTSIGTDISGRAWAFMYIGVAIVVAIGIVEIVLVIWSGNVSRLLLSVAAGILLIGNFITGWTPTERLPGPYQVSAQGRSIDLRAMLAAKWVNEHLSTDDCITADRMNGLLLGSYASQCVLMSSCVEI